ncbi:MAG: S-layer homology domain-containing protein, partial [Clostridiales bacterium]|nr:S-layer homology domain-containing protein [Clostridiales bacterium]
MSDWPEDYVAHSLGLIPWSDTPPAATAEVNAAFIYFGEPAEQHMIQGQTRYAISGLGVYDPEQAPPGEYRFVAYVAPEASPTDEEIFYGTQKLTVIDGFGYAYDISGTTLEATGGGAIGEPTELKLVLDFGTGAPTALTEGAQLGIMLFDAALGGGGQALPGADFSSATVLPAAISPTGDQNGLISLELPAGTAADDDGILVIAISGALPLASDCRAIIKFVSGDGSIALGHWEGDIAFTGGGAPAANIIASTLQATAGGAVGQPTSLSFVLKPSLPLDVHGGGTDTVSIDAAGLDFSGAMLEGGGLYAVSLADGRAVLGFGADQALGTEGLGFALGNVVPSQPAAVVRMSLASTEEGRTLIKSFGSIDVATGQAQNGIASAEVRIAPNHNGDLPAGSSYLLYLYSRLDHGGAGSAAATLRYTKAGGGGQASDTVFLTPSGGGGFAFRASAALPADAASVEGVDFAFGGDSQTVAFAPAFAVVPSLAVSFTGSAAEGQPKYLRVMDGNGAGVNYQYLGTDSAPAPIKLGNLAEGAYRIEVYGGVSGREAIFGSASHTLAPGANSAQIALTDVQATRITPAVSHRGSFATTGSVARIYWYDTPSGGAPLRASPYYDLLTGETVYAEAVPDSYYAQYLLPSARVQAVPGISFDLQARPVQTVAGMVATASGGIPQKDVLVTVSNSFNGASWSRSARTDATGAFSLQTAILPGASLAASRADLNDYALDGLEAQDYTGLGIEMSERTGLIALASGQYASHYYLTAASAADSAGNPVPASVLSSQYIQLGAAPAAPGPISLHLEYYGYYGMAHADVPAVELDGDLRGAVASLEWIVHVRPLFTLNKAALGAYYELLIYDSAGALASSGSQKCYNYNNNFIESSHYLQPGSYTALFTRRRAYNALGAGATGSIAGARAALGALGAELYSEHAFEIANGAQTELIQLDLPTGEPPAPGLRGEASGLSLEADADVVSARVTVTPSDLGLPSKQLSVQLATNQTTSSDGALARILKGSIYVNGRRAGNEVEFTSAALGYFDGIYIVTVPDIQKYGGWPATLQWQSYRTDQELVEASAYLIYEDDPSLIGEARIERPALSFHAPSAVGSPDFSVYGWAPKGARVTALVGGVAAGAAAASEKTGFYSIALSLGRPAGPAEYTLSARADSDGASGGALWSKPAELAYNSSLPALSKIEIADYRGTWATAWQEGGTKEGYWWYLNSTRYRLTFRNAGDAGDLLYARVNIPQSNGSVARLEAAPEPNSGESGGVWVTGWYDSISDPPSGAWVSYEAAPKDGRLTGAEYESLQAQIAEGAGFTVEQQQQAEAALSGTGLSVDEWGDDGRPAKMTLSLDDGATYGMALGGADSGAAEEAAAWPAQPQGAELDAEEAAGAHFPPASENFPYTRFGVTAGAFTIDQITRVPVDGSNGELLVREIRTANRYAKTICDTGSGRILRSEYERIGTMAGEPEGGDAISKAEALLAAWKPFYAALADIAEPGSGDAILGVLSDGDSVADATAKSMGAPAAGIGETKAPAAGACGMETLATDMGATAKSAAMGAMAAANCTCGGSCTCGTKPQGAPPPQGSYSPVVYYYDVLIASLERNGADMPMSDFETGTLRPLYMKARAARGKALGFQFLYTIGSAAISGLTSGGSLVPESVGNLLLDQAEGFIADKIADAIGMQAASKEMQQIGQDVYNAAMSHSSEYNLSQFPFNASMPAPASNCGCLDGGGDDDGDDDDGGTEEEIPEVPKEIIEPSGIVYEAVPSNVLPGVTAICYDVDPATGAKTLWDAWDYGQENPLLTDENGFYQWFTPVGGYSVTFSMPGYEDYETGEGDGADARQAGGDGTWYMPVPPVQIDVNASLRSMVAPAPESVVRTADGIYVAFTKYMDESTLAPENFAIGYFDGGSGDEAGTGRIDCIDFEIELLDSEEGAGGESYTRFILLKPVAGIPAEATAVDMEIRAGVASYAGVNMESSVFYDDLELAELPRVASVTADPAGGATDVGTLVALSSQTEDASIYYTTDGSEPTRVGGRLYARPIPIVGSLTLKAVAFKAGYADSESISATYEVAPEEENEYDPSDDPNNQPVQPKGAPTFGAAAGALPTGTVGTAYNASVAIEGAESVSVSAGGLPPGLSVAKDGLISGTPVAPGTYSFTLSATNTNGTTVSPAYTIGVEAASGNPPAYQFTVAAGSAGSGVPAAAGEQGGGKTTELGGNAVTTPEGQDPATNPDGSVTLPGGGEIATPGGTVIAAPPGTTISKDGRTVSFPAGGAGGEIRQGGRAIPVEPGMTIEITDGDAPQGGYRVYWDNPFDDAGESDWFYDDVRYAYTRGLMNGTGAGKFSPQEGLTRGMVATILYRCAGSPGGGAGSANSIGGSANSNGGNGGAAASPFSDVAEGAYYAGAARWAAASGIALGVGGGLFEPDAAVTRQDLAALLSRYADHAGIALPASRPPAEFADGAGIADYAEEAVG